MTLAAGTRLGSYEVRSSIGAGGMGEVYLARDTKLGRDVAIKVLPEEWGRDAGRLARVDREARVLASLNHPNIATLFGYEESDGVRFLAMEFVDGVTLSQRVAGGPRPIGEVLDVARQIAEALEDAHSKGVIHRDLKPANVKLTPEGRIKVLDFGLAKVVEDAQGGASQAETLTAGPGTGAGQVVGTAGYMSPEQARAQPLDARTDIWSFGCVLFELLTGQRAFPGQTFSDIIAAVLEHETDLRQLPPTTPPAVRRLLHRCLQKDRRRRLQSIGDARLELEDTISGAGPIQPAEPPRAAGAKKTWSLASVAAAVGIAAGLAAGFVISREPSPHRTWTPQRLVLPLPQDGEIWPHGGLAISPSGRHIAYVAVPPSLGSDGSQVYLQELTAFAPRAVLGTEGGRRPVFSPDGRWLAFWSGGYFRKVPLEGGEATVICAAPQALTLLSWPRDDLLLYTEPATGALMSVPASGGKPELFLEVEQSELFVGPEPLPEGRGVLLAVSRPSGDAVAAMDLTTRSLTKIRASPARSPHYLPTGHLLYDDTPRRDGPPPYPPAHWVVAPFDLERFEITGDAVEVLGDLRSGGYQPEWVVPHGSGILAYSAVPAEESARRVLKWVDEDGTQSEIDTEGREFLADSVTLSPDGRRLALSIREGTAFDLWVRDLERGTWLRLTFDGQSKSPLWTPDGTRIAFASGRREKDLYWVGADDGSSPELLAEVGTPLVKPTSFYPDGSRLLVTTGNWNSESGIQLRTMTITGDRTLRPLMDVPYPVLFGAYSPDGRWLAFVTQETGSAGVYLRAADLSGRRWSLSNSWGVGPAWSTSGREVFFQVAGSLEGVRVDPETGPGELRLVLSHIFSETGYAERSFEVGEGRFLIWPIPDTPATTLPDRVAVIPNWLDEVRARMNERLAAGSSDR